ncbi:hypothetical protein U1Q18_023068 [Sarracenia purpurea var. burkii]
MRSAVFPGASWFQVFRGDCSPVPGGRGEGAELNFKDGLNEDFRGLPSDRHFSSSKFPAKSKVEANKIEHRNGVVFWVCVWVFMGCSVFYMGCAVTGVVCCMAFGSAAVTLLLLALFCPVEYGWCAAAVIPFGA